MAFFFKKYFSNFKMRLSTLLMFYFNLQVQLLANEKSSDYHNLGLEIPLGLKYWQNILRHRHPIPHQHRHTITQRGEFEGRASLCLPKGLWPT